jgi:DNA polymerase elongation subunit (family B)
LFADTTQKMYANLCDIKVSVNEKGERIRWTGSTASDEFTVVTLTEEGTLKKYVCDPVSWAPDVLPTKVLDFVECDDRRKSKVLISPEDSTSMRQSRRASVFGVNVGGDCSSGACKKYTKMEGCTLSYDIETNMKGVREGGFGLVDEDILSIAAKCSCSEEFYACQSESQSSSMLVSGLITYIIDHMPMWIIGWNCYSFDNECMRYWCIDGVKDLFSVFRVGAFGKSSYGSILNIPGVYNVDLMVFMNKSLYKLPSFRLGDVAEYLGTVKKTKMPIMGPNVDPEVLREYNMNDCVVTMGIWKKEKIEYTIPSLALCMSSPVYDCCRYITGTMAPLGYASHLMSKGVAVRWGKCTIPQVYKGGYVMEPVRGVHESIVVCDFNSMYPSIVSSCNIDPHTVKIEHCSHDVKIGTVHISKNTTKVWLEDRVAVFNNESKSPVCEFMTFLITERSIHKKDNPMYASSLKVLANSLYGSFGYDKSSVYSPSCAAAITAIGRYCVTMSAKFLSGGDVIALYGDTDSVMTSSPGPKLRAIATVSERLDRLHSEMSRTTLHMMRMEIEEYYKKGIMLDKKRYCMLRENGTVKSVGVSVARRDVSAMCKAAAYASIDSMFKDTTQEAIDSIASFIFSVSEMAVRGKFTLKDVSRYIKKDGVSGYEYHSFSEGKVFVQEGKAELNSLVDADVSIVMKTVSEEIERFTVPCMIGKTSDITRAASMSSW